ncbi:MFS transporter [Limosilactobacillus fermentum]
MKSAGLPQRPDREDAVSYTLGIVGVALDRVPGSMTLSSTWLGLLGAGSSIGLFGSLLAWRLADRYGRRKFFMADTLALTLLSVLQLFTTNLAALLVIRDRPWDGNCR